VPRGGLVGTLNSDPRKLPARHRQLRLALRCRSRTSATPDSAGKIGRGRSRHGCPFQNLLTGRRQIQFFGGFDYGKVAVDAFQKLNVRNAVNELHRSQRISAESAAR
jgi:hypothetical protein